MPNATDAYVIQTGNFNSFQTLTSSGGFTGEFNNSATEVGLFAHGGSGQDDAVAFETFSTTGTTSGTARALQVGDNFSLTLFSATNPFGFAGVYIDSNTTYSSYTNYNTNERTAVVLGSSGNWMIRNAGTSVDTGIGAGTSLTLTLAVTSSKTFNMTINGTTYYDLVLENSGSLSSFALALQNDNGANFYIKDGSLSDTGSVTIGGSNLNLTNSGVISDGFPANSASGTTSNSLIKIGTGTIILTAANTYTGTTTISNGILQIGSVATSGTLGGGAITDNSVLTIARSNAYALSNNISGSGKVVFAGGGTTTYSGVGSYAGDTDVMNNSTLSLSTGSITGPLRLGGDFGTTGLQNLAQGATFNLAAATGNQTFAGVVNPVANNTSGALVVNSQNTSNTNTLSGGIFLDSNLTVNQTGNNGTLLLGAAASANTISFQSAGSRVLTLSASGGAASAITVNQSFTNVLDGSDVLVTTGTSTTGGSAVTINSDNSAAGSNLLLFNPQSGTLAISSANNLGSPVVGGTGYPDKVLFGGTGAGTTATLLINGSFSYGSATAGQLLGFAVNRGTSANIAIINVASTFALTMNGALSDFGGAAVAGNWQKSGAGALTLNAASSYAGTTTLNAGVLNLGNASAISTGEFLIGGNGSFDNTTGAPLTLSNAFTLSGGSPTFVGTNNLTINGATTITTAVTRTITVTNAGATLTLAGGVGNTVAGGILGKAGGGALTLSGPGAYTGGTTLTGGTLNINNATAIGTGTFTIGGGTTVDNTSGAGLTLTTNNTIILNGDFSLGNAAGTVNNNLNLGTGPVSSTGGRTVTLNGAGAVTFGGALANTNTGSQTYIVNNGTGTATTTSLSFGGLGLGAGTATTFSLNGSAKVNITGPVTDGTGATNSLAYIGSGVATLSGNNTYTGLTSVTNAGGTLTLSGDNTAATGGVTLSNGKLNVNSATALGTGTLLISGGTIDNTSGSAKTLTLNNPVTIGGDFAFSTSAGTVNNNLTLGIGAVSLVANKTITLNGAGALAFGGVLTNTGNSNRQLVVNNGTGTTAASSVSFGGYALTGPGSTAARVDNFTGSGNVNITGAVTDGISAGSGLTYDGTGTLALLSGASTYSGNTTISSGTLGIGADSTPLSGTVTSGPIGTGILVLSGGTVVATGGAHTIANVVAPGADNAGTIGGTQALTFAGSFNLSGIVNHYTTLTVNNTAPTTFSGGISMPTGTQLTLQGSGNVLVNSAITGAGNFLTYAGTGALTLSAANTYTGSTNVNSGTLKIDNNGTSTFGRITGSGGAASVAVNSGGTLLLTGAGNNDRIANTTGITLNGGTFAISAGSLEGTAATKTGGTVSGTSAVGLGALTLTANSTLNFDASGNSTLLAFTSFAPGTFTLNITGYSNANFNGTTNSGQGTDDRLIFMQDQSSNLARFNFVGSGMTAQEIMLDSGFWEVGVNLTPVPEPSTWAAAALAASVLGYGARKRFAKRLRVIG